MKGKIIAMVAAIGLIGFVAGCKITPETAKIISQNAGLASSVTWIAYDNPSMEAKNGVSLVLTVIDAGITNVQGGKTYSEVIYPTVQTYVTASTEIPAQYKPLVLAGSMAALNGIDILFAMHPEWKADVTLGQDCARAFIVGAKAGLLLPEADPVIRQARSGGVARAKVLIK